jgi:hypothetical protein
MGISAFFVAMLKTVLSRTGKFYPWVGRVSDHMLNAASQK